MSQKSTLSLADQQQQWIEDKLQTITEAISNTKHKGPFPNSSSSQTVVIKDTAIDGGTFGDIAAKL
jgi:hypothetical protein